MGRDSVRGMWRRRWKTRGYPVENVGIPVAGGDSGVESWVVEIMYLYRNI
jgi:hypothetical protein